MRASLPARVLLGLLVGLGPAVAGSARSLPREPLERSPALRPEPALESVRGLEGDSSAFRFDGREDRGDPSPAAAPRDSATLFEVVLAPDREADFRPLGRGGRALVDDPMLTSHAVASRSVVLLDLPEAAHELDAFLLTLETVRASDPDWLYLWGVAVDASSIEETARWLARLRSRRDRELGVFAPSFRDRLARNPRRLPRAVPEPTLLTALAMGLLLLGLWAHGAAPRSSGRARAHSAPTTRHPSSSSVSAKSKR